MTRTLKRLHRYILQNPGQAANDERILHAIWALGEARRDLCFLQEGKQKQFVYETFDDLEFRIAEAVEKEIE